jgi:uncharacterized Zn finger protein (UPF0148 family)
MCDTCNEIPEIIEHEEKQKRSNERVLHKIKEYDFTCPECGTTKTIQALIDKTESQSQKEALSRYQKSEKYRLYKKEYWIDKHKSLTPEEKKEKLINYAKKNKLDIKFSK